MSTAPCIPSNPDVSGIGVRTAIYIQNLLGFIPAISALWDGEVTSYELDAIETESTTILITAFAILLTTMLEAHGSKFTAFHASVVLSLSWMNNTNTFIYLLLYLQKRSQLGPRQIRADLAAAGARVKSWFCCGIRRGSSEAPADNSNDGTEAPKEGRTILGALFRLELTGIGAVALLGSLHLSLMSALGIWVWQKPSAFGNSPIANQCALDFSNYIILGKSIPLNSPALRIVSLVIYALFLAPGLNLLIPSAAFLAILLLFQPFHARTSHRRRDRDPRARKDFYAKGRIGRSLLLLRAWYNPVLFPTFAGLALLLAINLIFVYDTERTIRHNAPLRLPGDAAWSFGQILAMLLIVLPLRDLRVFGARRDFTAALRDAVRWQATADVVWNMVRRGADVNVKAPDSVYATALLLAVAKWRDVELARMLLHYGADPNLRDDTDTTALQVAASRGDNHIVNLLLAHGADPNIEGAELGTALQAAAHAGNADIVRLLLDHGADRNLQGGKYGTAMQAASERGHDDVVELLLREQKGSPGRVSL